jgi:solute carrier family 7 (L-type amino acid transporter), member 9/15
VSFDSLEFVYKFEHVVISKFLVAMKEEKAVGLQREMGLLAAINVIIGVMIGSGIFVSPSPALKYSGSVGFCLVVWAVCGVISLLGALCFAELGTVIPKSGAEYAYLIETYKKSHKFWGPLPAFICSWVRETCLGPHLRLQALIHRSTS